MKTRGWCCPGWGWAQGWARELRQAGVRALVVGRGRWGEGACSRGAAGACSYRVERGRLEEMVERALADGHDEPRRPAEDATAGGARR